MVLALCALLVGQLTSKKPNAWDIRVLYPRFSAGGPVARAANAGAKAQERKAFGEFLAEARKPEEGMGPYSLDVTPHRITDRAGLASGYVEHSSYMGGPHPNLDYDVVNYGRVGGKVRSLRLNDLFRPGKDAVGEASRALVAIINAMDDAPSKVEEGQWKRLTAEQAKHFVVGPKGVLFLFDAYDLGSYAEGPRQILVPFSKLPGLDRKGVLKAVL